MNLALASTPNCINCPIRHRAVCARCDEAELALLNEIKTYRSFKAGEAISWRGDALEYVGSVVEGVAALTKSMEDGRTQMVGLVLPSDMIGRPGRATIDFDITATTDVTLCCFQRKAFEEMVVSTPHLAQRHMELTLDELDAARDWMLLLGRKTARERIATFLGMLYKRAAHPDAEGVTHDLCLPMTRDQVANYLGLTLETVSRQLGALKKEGIILFSDRRKFDVTDIAGLLKATGDDTYLSVAH